MMFLATIGIIIVTALLVRKLTGSWLISVAVAAIKSAVFWFVGQAAIGGSFKSDDLTYWVRSSRFDQVFDYLQDFILEPEVAWGGGHWGYYLVNWVARKIFSDSPMGPIFLNSVVGLASGYLIYLVALELTGRRRFAAVLGTLFIVAPESLVWTSYNFKDPWVQMLTLGFLLTATKALKSDRISSIGVYTLFAVAIAISVWPFRYYVPPFMLISFGSWLVFVGGRHLRTGNSKRLLGTAVFVIGAFWMASYAGYCPSVKGVRCNGDADLVGGVGAIVKRTLVRGPLLFVFPKSTPTPDLAQAPAPAPTPTPDLAPTPTTIPEVIPTATAAVTDPVEVLPPDSVTYQEIEGKIVVPRPRGIRNFLQGMIKIFLTPRPWTIYDPYWPQLLPAAIMNWVLAPFALMGGYFLAVRDRRTAFIFVYVLMIVSAMTMFTNLIGPRQRFMLYPVIFVSQAYGLVLAIDYFRYSTRLESTRNWLNASFDRTKR